MLVTWVKWQVIFKNGYKNVKLLFETRQVYTLQGISSKPIKDVRETIKSNIQKIVIVILYLTATQIKN